MHRPSISHLAHQRGHRCDAHGSGLLGGLRHPEDRRRPRRARPHVHDRPRQRGLRRQRFAPFAPLVVGRTLDDITADLAAFWRELASDSQLRWLGPEKGVIHLSMAAIVNAVWDLYAKRARQAAVEAARGHDAARRSCRCIDFRYITDALTPDEAIDILERQDATKAEREAQLLRDGLPGLHDVRRMDGLFGRRGFGSCAARRLPRAGRTSR